MIALLHLSDIHIELDQDLVANRGPAIAAALRERGAVEACFVIVSGDVAATGLPEQYSVAQNFLRSIKDRLLADQPSAQVHYILVPGNHDCDFQRSNDLRRLVIDNLPSDDDLDASGAIAGSCLSVQEPFFDFAQELAGRPLTASQRIYNEEDYNTSSGTVRFHLYNTAWASQLKERAGTLRYPISLASSSDSPSRPVDVAVSVLHHPLNWFQPRNARQLSGHLERTSDVILTGHEHVTGQAKRSSDTGAEVTCITGGVLQEHGGNATSRFNIVWVDPAHRRQMVATYSWADRLYGSVGKQKWIDFARNPLLAEQAFENTSDWTSFLDDPGVAFTHPRQPTLRLFDIFVYPDLLRRSVDPVIAKRNRRVAGCDVVDFIGTKCNVVLTAPNDTGKTSLAKRLYVDLKQRKGVVPVFVTGQELHQSRRGDFLKLFVAAFEKQYSSTQTTRYKQLDAAQRVLLIDDFEQSKLSKKTQRDFIHHATQFAGSVVILADDLFMVERLTQTAADRRDGLSEFEHCEIQEFGFKLRGALIERWHRLGNESTQEPPDFDHRVVDAENLVARMLGKNLLPSVPLMVLMILQTAEAASSPGTASGAYGYLYEYLITAALAKASKTLADVDTKYTYLAHLAYAVCKSGTTIGLSRAETETVSQQYFAKFRIGFSVPAMLSDLERIDILSNADGYYTFRYKYIYCYFVARYFRDHISRTAAGRAEVKDMANRLHVEDYANVLVFYLYLSKDLEIIEYLLGVARKVYADNRACDFDGDVAFVNKLYVDKEPLRLPEGDASEHRDVERAERDALAEERQELEAEEKEEARDVEYRDDLSDLVKVNFALKTLHVMGQVLRNFPGSLQADIKADIATESYLLGLRTLRAVLKMAEVNLEELRSYLAKLIQEHRRVSAVSELGRMTDEAVIGIALNCAFGMTKRISNAVGLFELSGTFEDVLARLGKTLAVRMIDTSIKLDHFPTVPYTEIERLSKDVHGNHFTRRILRDMVANHLYLFKVDYKMRQRLGELLAIESTATRFISNPAKKDPVGKSTSGTGRRLGEHQKKDV